jgi:two-component system, chemotaxis family, chemotaxis protein CheY
MKFLLVDDSRTIRNIQKNVLNILGNPHFVEAGDGTEALSALAMDPSGYDAFLVDWNMPRMDGITFIKRYRERDKTTPIIMVTTEAEKSRIIEAIKAGVNNYVVKPFTPDALLERVRQTMVKRPAPAARPAAA